MFPPKKNYRPTFYFTINSLLIFLVLGVGLILTWNNYRATKKIVLGAAKRGYDQIVREVSQEFKHTYRPVFQSVRLLSMTPVIHASTLDERLGELNILSTTLKNTAELSALLVGYANGDCLIVRPIRSGRSHKLFQAPEKAAYVVDHINTHPVSGQRLLLRIHYDEALREISRNAPESTAYDPRLRPWYKQANSTGEVSVVDPYLFYFLREIGTTVSYKPPGSEAVFAADVTIRQLSTTLNKHLLTPNSEIVFLSPEGLAVAYTKPENIIIDLGNDRFKMADISDLKSGVLDFMKKSNMLKPGPLRFDYNGEKWFGDARSLNVSGIKGRGGILVMISPGSELLANAIKMVKHSLLVTLAILLLSILIASFIAALISKAMRVLEGEAVLISRFDFKNPITIRSRIKEVDKLAGSMDLMKTTISRFLALIKSLAGEQNFDAMLDQITEETLNVSDSDGVLTWLVDENTNTLNPGALYERKQGRMDVNDVTPLSLASENELVKSAREKGTSRIHLNRGQLVGLDMLFKRLETDCLLVTSIPLRNRQDEVIGLLCLLNKEVEGQSRRESEDGRMDFVRTFSGFAAVSLESRQLLEMQKRLMDSFMRLLAGAIDAKSPYTGGHCQRVPVITKMIAEAACEDDGLFKDFRLDEEGWEAVHLAGWLHDCGKVTTPEYVVDKSTKLETIYDRIHEIRTRFEVLKRDAEIRYWEKVAEGGNQAVLRSALEKELQGIEDDFAFVAECNLGGEFMAPEKIGRLEKIAKRKWTRTLDDRIGISWEEEKRRARAAKPDLPVEEFVLADRQDHIIERNENERMSEDNPWGFKLKVPEYKYNLGELYNLKVERGTLTAEERYKINDHIVQTIIMLEELPYPKHLKGVPELAGGHHETMDGKGYPKRLTGEQMSLTAKMMAIADIFEALTASDRPYKKAKKLSEAVRIMSFFKKDHHVDPDLFELFLRSGVYLDYAREYLDPDQIDEVDIESYLGV